MKKLMIAAAAAAMFSGAFAGNCSDDPVVTPEGPHCYCYNVYSFKANVKTTKGVCKTSKTTTTTPSGSICIDDTVDTVESTLVYRTKDSTAFAGYLIADCEECAFVQDPVLLLWDTKRKGGFDAPTITPMILNVMGKKQSEAEICFGLQAQANFIKAGDAYSANYEYTLTFAGLGKFDAKKVRYTSFSGNFAGTVSAPNDLKAMKKAGAGSLCCETSKVYECADLTEAKDNASVAYGTWSLKYNSSVSKKFVKKGVNALKVPAYADIDLSQVTLTDSAPESTTGSEDENEEGQTTID